MTNDSSNLAAVSRSFVVEAIYSSMPVIVGVQVGLLET